MPSMKLFKRMTTLKKEKNDIEREYIMIREKLDDAMFLNSKMDEQIHIMNDKLIKCENEIIKLRGESTNIGDSSMLISY
jgi:hypothetical protein